MTPGGVVIIGAATLVASTLAYGIAYDVRRWWENRQWEKQQKRAEATLERFEKRVSAMVETDQVMVLPSGQRLTVRCEAPKRLPSYTILNEIWDLPSASECPEEEL